MKTYRKIAKEIVKTTSIALVLFAAGSYAHALDEATQQKIGEAEFRAHCAACHGATGKGNGPVAAVLSNKPSDLTTISKRHNGKFPAERIYKVIDSRQIIRPHGDTQMPVWGHRYQVQARAQASAVPHDVSTQTIVHGRILSLVYYLASIQTM